MSSLSTKTMPDKLDRATQLNAAFVAVHKATGDSLRANVLQILRRDSFGVLELCEILDVPQPALSHHLKILFNAGLVIKRKEGTSVFYRRALATATDPYGKNFDQLIEQIYSTLDALPLLSDLGQKILHIHRQRVERTQNFFKHEIKSNPELFASQQALICEQSVYAESVEHILKNMQSPRNKALEVGPGEGQILKVLAKYFSQVTGIDSSETMLQRTQQTLDAKPDKNIQLQLSEFGEPSSMNDFNIIVLGMVLHHASSPIAYFLQARSQLSENGMLLVIELLPHDQDWVKQACGDLWLGFTPEALDEWARQTHFKPGSEQFLAQRNGFRIQIKTYFKQ